MTCECIGGKNNDESNGPEVVVIESTGQPTVDWLVETSGRKAREGPGV